MYSLISRETLIEALAKHGYTSVTTLGRGGYGEVYLVHYEGTDEQYAVKVSRSKGPAQELKALKSIWHPHIVYLYDTFVEQELLFLVFEYCSGGSLAKKVEEKPLSRRELCSVSAQVISALKACHLQNLAHLDIKPGNILIDKYGRAKLADFGISQMIKSGYSRQFQGTPSFTAPEILRKAPFDPFKADVWSLGVTLFRLATGEYPGNVGSRPFQVELLYSQVPAFIAKLIVEMMEPAPAKRIKLEDIDLRLFEMKPINRDLVRRSLPIQLAEGRKALSGLLRPTVSLTSISFRECPSAKIAASRTLPLQSNLLVGIPME
jgi:serine/threonine protein kinase